MNSRDVGKRIHYYETECKAAMVTQVAMPDDALKRLNLMVFYPEGMTMPQMEVPWADVSNQSFGTWHLSETDPVDAPPASA